MASGSLELSSNFGGGSGAGVTSLDSITGAVTLVAGTGIAIVDSSPNITISATGSGTGTVTTVSVVSTNGFTGTVANPTTTPAITLTTSITGLLKGNGTAISAATSGTDYSSGTITGPISISGNVSSLTAQTGTGTTFAMSAGPTFTGTLSGSVGSFSSTLAASNLSGTNTGDQTITLTGDVSGSGTGSFATTIAASTVTGKAITGFVSGAGTISASDTILQAINKLDGTDGLKAPLASPSFTGTINAVGLTASLPVQTDGSKNLISAAVNLSGSQATGTLAAGRFPALTGDVTTVAGALATTVVLVGGSSAANVNTATGLVNGSQSGSKFFSSPSGGGSGAPAFRAIVTGDLPSNLVISTFGVTVDGGGSVPAAGSVGFITIPYACTITNWYLAANASGSCVIDVKRSGTSIVGGVGNKPTLSSAISGNAAVASWTSTAISAGDILEFNLDSVSTISRVNLVVKVNRT